MKKTLKNLAAGLLLTFFALSFVACGHEPVFYGIMHDVVPEKATVSGNITTIVRATVNSQEYLFISGGASLAYKPLSSAQHGEWTSANIALPFVHHHYNYFATDTEGEGHIGEQIFRVIADQNYIYLLTSTLKQDNEYGLVIPETINMWACPLSSIFSGNAADWTNIAANNTALFPSRFETSESKFIMDFDLFYTNTPNPAHRKAFLSVTDTAAGTYTYYALAGAANPVSQDCSNAIKVLTDSKKILSAFYVGDTLYFSDSPVVCTNETASANASLACLSGVNSSISATEDLYLFKAGDSAAAKFFTAGSPVASLAFTADSLLIGKGSYSSTYTSNGGIERILLDASTGIPGNTTAEFENNATYQFTSSYILMALLCTDPTKKEAEAILYATISYRGSSTSSSASFTDVGLWSYYPARGNWNRE